MHMIKTFPQFTTLGLVWSAYGYTCIWFSCRFIPYCSSDVWSGTGLAPTPPPRPRQGREKERDRNANGSKFLQILVCGVVVLFVDYLMSLFIISWVHLHGIPDHPRGHQRPHPQRNQAGQGCHAVWHKVSLFYLSHSAAMMPTAFGEETASPGPAGPSPWPTINERSPILDASCCQQQIYLQSTEQWHHVY